ALRAIGDLQDRADSLEAALNRDVAGLRVDLTTLHASVPSLRAALTDDEALIELVSYRATAVGQHADSRQYGAFVLDKRRLQWVNLGQAAPIDTAVADLLEAAQDWSTSIVNHEAAATRESMRTAQSALDDLSRHVWRPIAPLVAADHIRRLR